MRILVLSPHVDDGELGCGGSMVRWIEEGKEVYYAFFSDCGTEGIIKECYGALEVLGIEADRILAHRYERRIMQDFRQLILDKIIEMDGMYEFDLVVSPSLKDKHQDHQTIAEEAVRGFKCSLICYEQPWNNPSFDARVFVELSEENVHKKLKALKEYKSQKDRAYMGETMLHLAKVNGLKCGSDYAEGYECVRWTI
jgi:LmbE family N-acetylglucosaminyl deacetylase